MAVDDASSTPLNLYDTLTPQRTAMTMAEMQRRLSQEVTAECAARLQLLERVRVSDLRKIIVQPAA